VITFAIPTYNRADKLKICVESIANQKPDRIVIADDASTDHTPEVCEALAKRYPCVKYLRFDDRLNFTGNYRRVVLASDTEYTWTFGDDDKLMDMSVAVMEGMIRNTNFDFYHVAETIRVQKSEAMHGPVWRICNTIGWLEFTGFISCNIGRTALLQAGVNSPQWEMYGKSAFPQSLAILEQMAERPAMMGEMGCVESAKMGDEDTAKRWADDSICWRYLYVGNGLKHLIDAGKIPAKCTEEFFRYIQGSLFDRLMRDFNGRAVLAPDEVQESDWDCLEILSDMVEGERGDKIRTWVKSARAKVAEEIHHWRAAVEAYGRLTAVINSIEFPVYPLGYLP
jgi:abequosyltransferase